MLKSILVLTASLVTLGVFAQASEQPVSWTFSLGNSGDVHAVLAQAEVEEGWYVYSQFLEQGGPIPTSLDFSQTPGIVLNGKATEEGDAISGYDDLFEMEVTKFKHHASFTQAFTLPKGVSTVNGTIEFMACTSKKCLPPQTLDISLAVPIK